jgi:hypothetical protein
MRYHFESPLSTGDLACLLDDLSAGCDPEFDSLYEELEREFAERRLHFSSIA